MLTKNDFTNFSARAYLKEYYLDLNPENKFLLSFYNEFYNEIPYQNTLIEVGGGPTIYQLLSAVRKVNTIIFSEFAESCRDEIKKFLESDVNSWNWDEYMKYELMIGNHSQTVEEMKDLLRSKIKVVIPCDIRKSQPLLSYKYSLFDILSMGSVADSISSTEEEFLRCMANAFTLLKSGGFFVGFFAKNFKSWTHQNQVFNIFPVDENYIEKLFRSWVYRLLN